MISCEDTLMNEMTLRLVHVLNLQDGVMQRLTSTQTGGKAIGPFTIR